MQTIKKMVPHYKLPEVPPEISIPLNGPDGVLLLVIVISFFIVSNETTRVLIINLALAISAKVKEVLKSFIYSIGDAQLNLSYESGHLYFYWILCWLICRIFRRMVISTYLSELIFSQDLFVSILITLGITLVSIVLAFIPTLVLGLSTWLYKRVSDLHRKLLSEIEGFQTFARILISLSSFLRFSNMRIRFAYVLAFLLFACVVLYSSVSVFPLVVWLCVIYTMTYYNKVVALIVVLKPTKDFMYVEVCDSFRELILIYLNKASL
jgi:hypothetical protein